jgi:hypothetical protein
MIPRAITQALASKALHLSKTQVRRLVASGRLRPAPRTIIGAPEAVTIASLRAELRRRGLDDNITEEARI